MTAGSKKLPFKFISRFCSMPIPTEQEKETESLDSYTDNMAGGELKKPA